ncbi:MAG TPA: signal peptidase I [Clostridia bacterium]|nr:MAG: Signal peptidase I T [Firmicutes bacterium ADurb.Bin356]HOF93991.1 signal peptidase I [Clostridia bacterium]HOR13085.1 signal peptidase I [Clostridia bacterium]
MKSGRLNNRELTALKNAAEELHNNDSEYKRAMNLEFLLYLAKVLLIALAVRAFIGEPVIVEGESMYPTLLNSERMVVEKVSYALRQPRRGEIIVCNFPGFKEKFVKRIIGLPGDELYIWDGEVYINGSPLNEKAYWNEFMRGNLQPFIVPENTVFVMGDNRNHSSDSREAFIGPIPYEKLIGHTVAVMWPLNRLRTIPPVEYSD